MELDKKDRKILNLLQKDSRMMLKDIAKAVNLSIDSTHKRMKKMQNEGIYRSTILIDPIKIGYPLVVDIKIKLKDIDDEKLTTLMNYLKAHPNVIELFFASGDYDITAPIIARNYDELNEISLEIRKKFKDIISDWKSALNLKVYKFEEYNMEKLGIVN
ncbi:MAG: Lrp/AsnC family transcriptional regulator [Candidatus Woesearchaeota archaeon]|jgi:DNA-binding Lrp family transcriptional regulator